MRRPPLPTRCLRELLEEEEASGLDPCRRHTPAWTTAWTLNGSRTFGTRLSGAELLWQTCRFDRFSAKARCRNYPFYLNAFTVIATNYQPCSNEFLQVAA